MLERRLQEHNQNPPSGQNGHLEAERGIRAVISCIWDPIKRGLRTLTGTEHIVDFELPVSTNSRQSQLPATQDTQHLLMCIDQNETWTGLYQPCIRNVMDDRQLLQLLRYQYHRSRFRLSWLTLRSVKRISLTRVSTRLTPCLSESTQLVVMALTDKKYASLSNWSGKFNIWHRLVRQEGRYTGRL